MKIVVTVKQVPDPNSPLTLEADNTLSREKEVVLDPGDERTRTLEALKRAAGFVRHELASRLELREVPEIRFELDTSVERGARVDDILRRLETGEPIPDEDAT